MGSVFAAKGQVLLPALGIPCVAGRHRYACSRPFRGTKGAVSYSLIKLVRPSSTHIKILRDQIPALHVVAD